MRYNVHPEFGCFCLSSTLRRKAGLALAFIVFGSIAGASGVVVQMAGHEPNVDGRSVIAIPLSPNAALSTTISPAPPAVSAPDNRQDSALPSNSAQASGGSDIHSRIIVRRASCSGFIFQAPLDELKAPGGRPT